MAAPFGREKILSKYERIDASNVADALSAALPCHTRNKRRIDFLYRYYRGITPVLNKKKEYRQEVNNRVGVATATEIVAFFVGYIIGDPIAYIRHDSNRDVAEDIVRLNDWCRMAGKERCDVELVEWAMICGTAYRACAPERRRAAETPFTVYSLDPRKTFVAYSRANGSTPVFAAVETSYSDGNTGYTVSTDDAIYEIVGGEIVATYRNEIGAIPIVEYPANPMRIGVFEPVLPQLDALETIQSSRVDAVVQDVDNVLAIIGTDPGEEDDPNSVVSLLQELKMLVLPPDSDAKYITAPLKQGDIQTVYDSVYASIVSITGVPNRNGGSSTSDTGKATELRDGWAAAEGRAKQFVGFFKSSELEFLRVAMSIARLQNEPTIPIRDIEPKFPRRYTENALVAVQALQGLVGIGVSIEDALPMVNLVSDPLDVAMRNAERIDKVLFGGSDGQTNNAAEVPEVRETAV